MRDATLTTRVVEGAQPHLELQCAELDVVAGPDKGCTTTLGAGGVRIGSARDCELVLHDATVSSYHAEVQLTPRGYTLRDLRSKNGVMLGKWMVDRVRLADGMRFALGQSTLRVRAAGGQQRVPLARPGVVGRLVARSPLMRALVSLLERLAPSDTTVLIEGETGTGKELVAQALHQLSERAREPLVVVDCGAIPPNLFAAELFGYEKGAFTGANVERAGLFEEADGGTLFLDEVGELPIDLQPVLLRAIEHKRTRRVGGARDVAHDVRVVAATNRNLREEVRRGTFREDLYYRLAVGRLRLPALRDRREDIPVLARQLARTRGLELSDELLELLTEHEWPGNVRQLENTLVRASISSDAVLRELAGARGHGVSGAASLHAPGGEAPAERALDALLAADDGLAALGEARRRTNDYFERRYLELALERAGGNLSRAADIAAVSRSFFMRLAAKHGLRAKDRRGD